MRKSNFELYELARIREMKKLVKKGPMSYPRETEEIMED